MNAVPPAANPRRRAQQLNVCVVGLIAAIGGVIYVPEAANKVSELRKAQPAAIAAEALQARSVVIGNANASDKPMERPLQAAEPVGSRTIGVGEERIDEGGIGTQSSSGALSTDGAVVTPVVGHAIEKPGSDTENRADGSAEERMPSEAVRTDPIAPATNAPAEEPSRREEPSLPPLARESRSAVDQADNPVAIQAARAISGVNMRAGPGNGQQVLLTIPRGSPVEVIECRLWCEVIFAGQRGWVYKTFISAPPADAAMSPDRARPTPRKAGSNGGALRSIRTSTSDPHRPKPVTARLSADQSARDARCRSHSSSGIILWGAVEYLWNQLRPAASGSNCD